MFYLIVFKFDVTLRKETQINFIFFS